LSYTQQISRYSAEFAFDKIPASAIKATKLVVLDALGALIVASPTRYQAVKIIGDLVKCLGGTPECTILGRDFKSSALNAALVMGTMGYVADIEGGEMSRIHAPAVFVPTALVMGERQDADGKKFIASLVLAYDIAGRVSDAARSNKFYPHSFHPSSVFGTFGAAAVAGFNLGLNAPAFADAYGLAGLMASGLMSWVDDPTEHSRPFVMGNAARNGILAALLAKMGFGGPQGIFDAGKYNIYDAFSDEMHLDSLLNGLGTEFLVEKALTFKLYYCCGDIQPGIYALLKILEENSIETSEIREIVMTVKGDHKARIDNNPLKSHNAQYILAVAAVNRESRWDDFVIDHTNNREIQKMLGLIKLQGSDLLSKYPFATTILQVKTENGSIFEKKIVPSQEAMNWMNTGIPLTQNDLEERFLAMTTSLIGSGEGKQIIKAVNSLESLSSVRELLSLIQFE